MLFRLRTTKVCKIKDRTCCKQNITNRTPLQPLATQQDAFKKGRTGGKLLTT